MSVTSAAPALPDDDAPYVELLAAPRYYIGLPFVVAVTFENRSKDAEFLDLPSLDLLTGRAAMGVHLTPNDPHGKEVNVRFPRPEEDARGMALMPGEKRRMVCDLSNLGVPLVPGKYNLVLTLYVPPGGRPSNSNPVELVALSNADAAEAKRLRAMGGAPTDTGAWAPFLKANWNTVSAPTQFDSDAATHLALHLFLHKAYYGPTKPAQLDPKALDAITLPALSGEVAALRYEVLHAAKSPLAAAARSTLTNSFPGSEARASDVDQNKGSLTTGRRAFGAERTFLRPPASFPYVP